MSKLPLPDLGAYLREQRESAQLSLRQLAEMAGVSNPYLSQIERGLKRPSAEILQQIAKGLQVSAESLYVRAGILDERVADGDPAAVPDVLSAIAVDPVLTDRQRAVLVDIYLSFVGEDETAPETTPRPPRTPRIPAAAPRIPAAAPRRRPSRSTPAAATPELNENEKEN
jgi:transcriptional regulator with XRE-family HTH domain